MPKPGGTLYAIGAVGTSWVKIGYTTSSVLKRLKTLQTGQPFRLQVLASLPVETDVQRIEKQVHAYLTPHKGQGEWFEIPMDQATLEALIARAVDSLMGQAPVENDAAHTGLTLGERVALLRRRRGLRQADLAAKLGVRGNTVSRIEQSTHGKWGFEDVKGKTLVALARSLHVSTNYLLGLSEDDRDIEWGPAPALHSQGEEVHHGQH